jgi:hypothetical protein
MRMTEHAQPAHGGCGYEYLIQSLGLEGVIVGATYSTINGVREDFTYSKDANSSLGVALNNGNGWSADGTQSWDSTGSEDFGFKSGRQELKHETGYVYGEYNIACLGEVDQPTEWASGAQNLDAGSMPAASFCVPRTRTPPTTRQLPRRSHPLMVSISRRTSGAACPRRRATARPRALTTCSR